MTEPNILDPDSLDRGIKLFGVLSKIRGQDYVLITHRADPGRICECIPPTFILPAGLPAPEDPQGEWGLYLPFQRYDIK